ncbi:MAG: SPOR domain-containing protein [Candidatus Phaeomarinobacter sp.]
MRQPPVQMMWIAANLWVAAFFPGFMLAGCAQGPDASDITTASISVPVTTSTNADLPPSVPGEGLEARLARLEYDLAQLKLDYSIVRPSFEQLVSREADVSERLSALEGALGPITTASVPTPRKPANAGVKPAQPAAIPKSVSPKAASTTSAPGEVGLHLASYRTLDRLKEGWVELKTAHPAELSGLKVRVQRIDTGKSGVFRRLLAGPVNSRTAADGLCRTLAAKGVYCKAVTFSGNAL